MFEIACVRIREKPTDDRGDLIETYRALNGVLNCVFVSRRRTLEVMIGLDRGRTVGRIDILITIKRLARLMKTRDFSQSFAHRRHLFLQGSTRLSTSFWTLAREGRSVKASKLSGRV